MQDLTLYIKVERSSFACGGFGAVHRGVLHNGPESIQTVAVKFPNISRTDEERRNSLWRWERELQTMRSMSHPRIVACLGFCVNSWDETHKDIVGMVLSFFKNGDASSFLRTNVHIDRFRIIVSAAATLFAMHDRPFPVVHGDIKAANILIDDEGSPLFSDFGLSRICNIRGFTTRSIMGSTRWMASELLRCMCEQGDMEETIRTTTSSDIWSFGMTMLELLTGDLPFNNWHHDATVLVQVGLYKARPPRLRYPQISDVMWSLLECCWQEEPDARPDARHIGLAIDIIYGLRERHINAEVVVMSTLVTGSLDGMISQAGQPAAEGVSLPYRCKWAGCLQSFRSIGDCVVHECEEFDLRSAMDAHRLS